MGNVIYTAGYGNLAPADFVKKLKDAGVKLVIDVRERPGAWSPRYRAGDSGMCDLLVDDMPLEDGIVYLWSPELGKPKDMPLADYVKEVLGCMTGEKHLWLCGWWTKRSGRTCLLCAEGNPFEKDGVTPRCHRVYVSEALVEQLGEGWRCVHL